MKDIINFVFELGHLKRIKHEGWRLAGVSNLESVADHALRASQIGYILAKLEGYEKPEEVCAILAFHDMAECRIGDIHKLANRYIKADEERAAKEQAEPLGDIGKDVLSLWTQIEHKSTTAGIIAKDADLLEQAFAAKEYMEKGYDFAHNWIVNISKALKTESAKKMLKQIEKTNSNDWWQGLKKIS